MLRITLGIVVGAAILVFVLFGLVFFLMHSYSFYDLFSYGDVTNAAVASMVAGLAGGLVAGLIAEKYAWQCDAVVGVLGVRCLISVAKIVEGYEFELWMMFGFIPLPLTTIIGGFIGQRPSAKVEKP